MGKALQRVAPDTITFQMMSKWRAALEKKHGRDTAHKDSEGLARVLEDYARHEGGAHHRPINRNS